MTAYLAGEETLGGAAVCSAGYAEQAGPCPVAVAGAGAAGGQRDVHQESGREQAHL